MVYNPTRKCTNVVVPILRIRGTQLIGVDHYDYLGGRLESKLTFKQQISRTVASCNTKLFTLAKIRHFISDRIAILIYKSLILSKLTYGGIVCWSAHTKELGKLQKTQNRALRICYRAPRYTSNLTLHTNAKLYPLHLRRKFELLKIMYLKNRGANEMSGLAAEVSNVSNDCPSTRYNTSFPPEFVRPNTTRFLISITYQGPKIWAALLNHVKSCADLTVFICEIES